MRQIVRPCLHPRLGVLERCQTSRQVGMSAKITKSSGNVYADLGLENPDEHALKAKLARQIAAVMKDRGLTQTVAARRLGITQPDVSKLLRGHFRQFSVERLMRFLVGLGQDVEIVMRASFATAKLPADKVEPIAKARMHPRHRKLDTLLGRK